jgi:hypothetical protein
MLFRLNPNTTRQARRWAWVDRPYESIDNPVKKYLRRSAIETQPIRLGLTPPTRLRPAF